MLGLLLKDIYNLKKTGRTLLLFLVLYGAFAVLSGEFSILSGLCAMIAVLLPISAFSLDQSSQWNVYAVTLPIRRRLLVTSRYVFTLLCLGVMTALQILVGGFVLVQSYGISEMSDHLLTCLFIDSVLLFLLSLGCAALFRFGPEKGRIVMMAIAMLPAAALLLFTKLMPEAMLLTLSDAAFRALPFLSAFKNGQPIYLWSAALFCLAASLLCFGLSCLYSCRYMEKQEF